MTYKVRAPAKTQKSSTNIVTQEAFEHMSSGAIIKASIPEWLLRLDLTKRLRDIRVASEELTVR